MILEGMLANDKVDQHGEALSAEVLQSMVADISAFWIPMGIEHDPRIPPQGRILSATLRREADGSTSVVGRMELFASDKEYPYEGSSARRLRPRALDEVRLVVDRGSSMPEVMAPAKEVAALLDTRLGYESKKSVEPLTVITLVIGTYVLGEIAGGFLKKLGADIYDTLKAKVKATVSAHRKAAAAAERLFTLRVGVQTSYGVVDIDVILENPTTDDIESLLEEGFVQLQEALNQPGLLEASIGRIVFMYRDRQLSVHFAVRQDVVPLGFAPASRDA